MDLKDIAALFFSTAALVISISNFVRSMWSARALRYLEINQRRLALVAKATVSEVASRAARRTLSNLQIEVARQGRLADFPELEDFIQSYTKQIAQVDKVKVELQKAVPTDPKSQAALEKVMDLAEAHFNSELSEAQAEDHAHLVRNNLQLRSA